MVAEERGYSEGRRHRHADLLVEKEIDTVGDLRVLTEERIEKLELPPVVTEYMLRVHAGWRRKAP